MSWRASNTFTWTCRGQNETLMLGTWAPLLPRGFSLKDPNVVMRNICCGEEESPQGEGWQGLDPPAVDKPGDGRDSVSFWELSPPLLCPCHLVWISFFFSTGMGLSQNKKNSLTFLFVVVFH